MHKPQRYSLINLAESIRRGGDIKAAKYERGLSGMINPQAKRHLRIEAERVGRQGLEDRRLTPKYRRPFTLTPYEVKGWN